MFQLGSPSEPLRTAKCQPLQTLKSPRYAIRVCKTRERERERERSHHMHITGEALVAAVKARDGVAAKVRQSLA